MPDASESDDSACIVCGKPFNYIETYRDDDYAEVEASDRHCTRVLQNKMVTEVFHHDSQVESAAEVAKDSEYNPSIV